MARTRDRIVVVAFSGSAVRPARALWDQAAPGAAAQDVPAAGAAGATTVLGVVDEITIAVQSAPGRIDMWAQGPAANEGATRPAFIENPHRALEVISDFAHKAFKGYAVQRLAVVFEDSELVGSPEESVRKIRETMIGLPAPENAVDLQFQTGVRLPLSAIEGEELLALRKWVTAKAFFLQAVPLAAQMQLEVKSFDQVLHTADVATVGNESVRFREQPTVIAELAGMAEKLMSEGLAAFGSSHS